MKKALSFTLVLAMCLLLLACSRQDAGSNEYDALIGYIEADNYLAAYAELNRLMGSDAPPYLVGAPAADADEENAKEIEITPDNWQDYFEFRDAVTVYRNAFEEMTDFTPEHKFGIKKTWEDSIVSVDLAIEFSMSGGGAYLCTYDAATGALSFGEKLTEEELEASNLYISEDSKTKTVNYNYNSGITYLSAGTDSDPNSTCVYSSCWPNTLELNGEQGSVYVTRYDSVEITRIKGTIKIAESK